jgi:hypothetical protein
MKTNLAKAIDKILVEYLTFYNVPPHEITGIRGELYEIILSTYCRLNKHIRRKFKRELGDKIAYKCAKAFEEVLNKTSR